jgi:anthranilate/para-aminobenzoate synthase component I
MEISKFLVIARSSNYCKDRKAEIHPIAGTLKKEHDEKRCRFS